jgi:hypothetical protein
LKHWINKHFYDFEQNEELKNKMLGLISDCLDDNFTSLAGQLKRSLYHVRVHSLSIRRTAAN